jgi:hypothetical protein
MMIRRLARLFVIWGQIVAAKSRMVGVEVVSLPDVESVRFEFRIKQ